MPLAQCFDRRIGTATAAQFDQRYVIEPNRSSRTTIRSKKQVEHFRFLGGVLKIKAQLLPVLGAIDTGGLHLCAVCIDHRAEAASTDDIFGAHPCRKAVGCIRFQGNIQSSRHIGATIHGDLNRLAVIAPLVRQGNANRSRVPAVDTESPAFRSTILIFFHARIGQEIDDLRRFCRFVVLRRISESDDTCRIFSSSHLPCISEHWVTKDFLCAFGSQRIKLLGEIGIGFRIGQCYQFFRKLTRRLGTHFFARAG